MKFFWSQQFAHLLLRQHTHTSYSYAPRSFLSAVYLHEQSHTRTEFTPLKLAVITLELHVQKTQTFHRHLIFSLFVFSHWLHIACPRNQIVSLHPKMVLCVKGQYILLFFFLCPFLPFFSFFPLLHLFSHSSSFTPSLTWSLPSTFSSSPILFYLFLSSSFSFFIFHLLPHLCGVSMLPPDVSVPHYRKLIGPCGCAG